MIQSHDHETIVAQCTPTGAGAIALLRVSGDAALSIVSRVSSLPGKKLLEDQPSHTIHYGTIVDNNKAVIDQVMFLVMHEPKTFTGQNTVEITCHNNAFIIQAIIEQIIAHGGRIAQEGEFTKRAVLNGKIDLVQAEAINELIHAHTKTALKKNLAQLTGSFSHTIQAIEKQLLHAIALCEASFEFIDEEITFDEQIHQIIDAVLTSVAQIKKNFDQQQQLKDGIRIAIIGSVNAGKSSLFNALLGKQRAIVTNIAGTTRDVIEAGVYRAHHYWTLVDTAGLRQTDDIIEQEGIARSFEQAALADIILLVFDASAKHSEEEKKVYAELLDAYTSKIITVYNKSDSVRPEWPPEVDVSKGQNKTSFDTISPLGKSLRTSGFGPHDLLTVSVSTKTGQNISALEIAIEHRIAQLFAHSDSPFFLNTRQFNLISGLEQKLVITRELFSESIAYELLSCHLNDALACLSELTGKDISEKAMDAIFKEFCVGK